MINKPIFALSFLIIFLAPLFCFAQELPIIRLPQTLEEAGDWIENFLRAIPYLIKDFWQKEVWPAIFKVLNWLKVKIWDGFLGPYLKAYFQKKVPQIEKEFQKEKEEIRKEIPKVKESLWQKFKKLFSF